MSNIMINNVLFYNILVYYYSIVRWSQHFNKIKFAQLISYTAQVKLFYDYSYWYIIIIILLLLEVYLAICILNVAVHQILSRPWLYKLTFYPSV